MSKNLFKNTIALIIKGYNQFRGLFPEALPVGMPQFEAWSQSIADTYHLPTNNMDSIRFTLSTILMHSGPTVAYKSKFYFVLVLRAGAAKQVAGAWFQQIKQKQQAEATANAAAVANENPKI